MQLPSDWQARVLPNPLPNGLDPFEDESLAGFVMRLAGNHGFSRPADILKPMGEEFSTVKKLALHAAGRADLAHYLRLEQQELDALSYGERIQCSIFGHALHRDLMAHTERKLCPICVSEHPYHRAIWDLTLVSVCPEHSVRLRTKCFACDHKLNWRVGPITHCPNPKCAADQRDADVTEVPADEMHGTTLLSFGVQPVSGPDLDGGRQLLFRRADLEKVDPKCLISGRSKLKQRTDNTTAQIVEAKKACDAALETALRREFGVGLARRYNVFRNEVAGLIVQMMIAPNCGTLGTYHFLLSEKQRRLLDCADDGWLSLGFMDRLDYILVPWETISPTLGVFPSYQTRDGQTFRMTFCASSNRTTLSPFGNFLTLYERETQGAV